MVGPGARLLDRALARHPWHVAVAALAAGLTLAEPVRGQRPLALLPAALTLLVHLHGQRRKRPRAIAGLSLAGLALTAGLLLGTARLTTLDAPARRVSDGAALSARALLLSHPRPSAFGSSAELRISSGRLAGLRLMGRLPRWGVTLDDAPIGSELRLRGELHSLAAIAAEDRGREFQVAPWLRRLRLAGELQVDQAHLTGGRRAGLAGTVDRIRTRAEAGVNAGLPSDRAALLRGMVLGEDEQIPAGERDEFQAAGLSHILAVSGQNVMLLVALALPALIAAGLSAQARGLVLLTLIALYVPLAGAGPSLQRAGIMGAAAIASQLAARPTSRSYALLLAAALTLALDPRAATDPGWQLSFAAVAGILTLGRPLARALQSAMRAFQPPPVGSRGERLAVGHVRPPAAVPEGSGRERLAARPARSPGVVRERSTSRRLAARLLDALAEGIAITLAATIATAPLLAHIFGSVSLASLPANVLALPAIAPAMWLGMLKAVVGQLPALGVPAAPLAGALGAAASLPLALIALLAERCAEIPHAQVALKLRSPLALLGVYLLLATVALAVRGRAGLRPAPLAASALEAGVGEAGSRWRRLPPRRRSALRAGLALAVTLAALAAFAPPRPPDALTVRFLDVGQGDATLIQHPDGTAVLFDGGPPEAGITSLLRRAGVRRLALVVATHMSRDHHGGLRAVLESFPVGLLLDGGDGTRDRSFRQLEAEADRRGIRRVPALAPLDLRVGGLRIQVLSPPPRPPGPPPDDPNPRAVTAIVSSGGFDLMLSGDAESPTLSGLPLPDVDAIKVPHHGSSDPGLPAVLRRLRPELAGIEVGAHNTYGHPAPSTLAALARAGVRTYRTDRDGTVSVTVEDGAMRVETER